MTYASDSAAATFLMDYQASKDSDRLQLLSDYITNVGIRLSLPPIRFFG
jgi:hypothetical protein